MTQPPPGPPPGGAGYPSDPGQPQDPGYQQGVWVPPPGSPPDPSAGAVPPPDQAYPRGPMPPPGPGPAAEQGYPPDQRYLPDQGPVQESAFAPPAYPLEGAYAEPAPSSAGYAEPVQPEAGYVEPQFLPPGYPPPTDPPAPHRSTPLVAPVLALLGVVLVAAASFFAIDFLGDALDDGATAAEASSSPAPVTAAAAGDPIAAVDEATAEPAEPSAEPDEATAEPVDETAVPATEDPELDETLAPSEAIAAAGGSTPDIKGSILFTRLGGDIWSASGRELRNLTATKAGKIDSSPTWSPDGRHVYFIRRGVRTTNNARLEGKYTFYPTDLMRIKANGADRKTIYESLLQGPGGLWFSHVLQPSVSRNGTNVAVVSDGADGRGDVILHVVNPKTGRMRKAQAPNGGLGHNDPDFSADGTRIAYTYNNAAGTVGAPRIGIYKCKSRANCSQGTNRLLRPGFANPSWSPDAKWLAVEQTDGTGRDIAIIGASRGDVRALLTDDGNSFSPEVSPDGDQIAYLRRDGTGIDLRVMTLDVDSRGFPTLLSDRAITTDGLVDGGSNPSWYIPRDQRDNPDIEVDADEAATASDAPVDGEDASEGAPAPPA